MDESQWAANNLASQRLGSLQTAAASGWHNLTNWAINVTRHAPLLEDIFWAGPRIFSKLGSYITSEHADSQEQARLFQGEQIHIAVSDSNLYSILAPNFQASELARNGMSTIDGSAAIQPPRLSLDGARGLGSVFSYATSKWALSCVAMAIILNRTHIFAATRRRLRLGWHIRTLLRLMPIVLLTVQSINLLRSIQCQTSSQFSQLRWADPTKRSDFAFAYPNTFMNSLSSFILLGASDTQSCEGAKMVPNHTNSSESIYGSLHTLWPLFGVLCLSHFVETISCAVQGRPLAAETGMTLFEQSLAFAEADAAVNNQLSWGTSSQSKHISKTVSMALPKSLILNRVNTSPEVLFIAFLSSMTHLTSHILGVFDRQSRYRLANTGFWGMCFMASIVWSAFEFEIGNPSAQGLLRFPTVCIVGFVPHVLVLAGIVTCLLIYCLALTLSAVAPPSNPELSTMSLRQRISYAHSNMQANMSLSDIRITREMDFYTALLRTGFAAISMASEAVYLNEDRGVSVQRHTWLEEERLREVEELQRQAAGSGLINPQYDQIGVIGLVPVKEETRSISTGYSRERAAQKLPKGRGERSVRSGTGAAERSSRWLMAIDFLLSISRLLAWSGALIMLWIFSSLRIRTQPSWLLRLARREKHRQTDKLTRTNRDREEPSRRGSPLPSDELIPRMEGIDVEAEFRRVGVTKDEDSLDSDLYKYWLKGGWWGSRDASGDYEPDDDDFWDTTSVVSISTAGSAPEESDERWQSDDDGMRTPTRDSVRWPRETGHIADSPLDLGQLARLLHPVTSEERQEAHTLSAHLQSEGIMTRSTFRRREQLQRSRVLARPAHGGAWQGEGRSPDLWNATQSREDEENALEQLLLSRRQTMMQTKVNDGAVGGDSSSGIANIETPPCVVCQSSARTIIVWPCRCLSLCDDCRVSLAMNNFDKCVCCRRDVMSFSRIFVP